MNSGSGRRVKILTGEVKYMGLGEGWNILGEEKEDVKESLEGISWMNGSLRAQILM